MGQYLIHTVLATFFAVGYMFFFHRLHAQVVARGGFWLHLRINALTVGVGLGIHVIAGMLMLGQTSWFYHNVALFVLLTPFFFDGFSKLETVFQLVCVTIMWEMHHAGELATPLGLVAAALSLALLVGLRAYPKKMLANLGIGELVSLLLAGAFWLTIPTRSTMLTVMPEDRLWATVMYGLMAAVTLGSWAKVLQEDAEHAELDRIANYNGKLSSDVALHQQTQLADLFTQTQAQNGQLALASLDLDHFKQINARYGHLAGNAVLLAVSETIQAALQQTDTQALTFRTNGEELNIVFPGVDVHQATPVLRLVAQAVRTHEYVYAQRAMNVTMSVSVTALRPTDRTIDDVYRRADDAVYKSKRNGRDLITVDAEVITPVVDAPKDYSSFRYFAQGVYALAGDQARVLHELLLRRFDTGLGRYVLPDEFELPPVEIARLLRQAMGHTDFHRFNVNLTAAQFKDEEMAAALCDVASAPDGPVELNVEVTDVVSAPLMRHISALYRASGIKIYIDDVGSDNSYELVRTRLAYVDGVKFAMQNLRRNNDDGALRERISFWRQVAEDNHLQFILEGAETEADIAMAREFGVRFVQGYYFGKPEILSKSGERKA
ncbi:Signal transduction diguanylate cyclase [Lacticaseibacillus manihotivorans DSM 13343 = JCM 12514]|uniref:Signal transduction diguanylate cyclase n=1 Tax=Lacticaseibacillus manihotivorans DSM 13343 = JCM 12514 TaxID=1423769 RepID=A0A0R1RB84_9LACO|nr:Signal transduction diguanylate cyclase [Lacticaseibacillus manihotivorans DSM 13343 = JCM 12514]